MKEWERQKGERNLWFDRFTRFRLQGPGRSLLALYNEWRIQKGAKKSDSVAVSWRRACEQWQWRKRAEAWDESERQKLEEEWADRRAEIRTKEWDKAQELIARAETMLKHPIVERIAEHTTEDGEKQIIVLKPVNWRAADIPRFLEAASKLARLAAQMETIRATQEITGAGGGEVVIKVVEEWKRKAEKQLGDIQQMGEEPCATPDN